MVLIFIVKIIIFEVIQKFYYKDEKERERL